MSPKDKFISAIDVEQVGRHSGVSWRSFTIGLLGAAFVAGFTPYNDYYLYNTFFVGNHLPVGIVFTMVLLTLFVNTFVKFVAEGRHLSASELMVIWMMMAVAGCIPASGLMRYFFNMFITPVDRARFDPIFVKLTPYIPQSLLVTLDAESDVVAKFLEGDKEAGWALANVPWEMWIPPVLRWFTVIFAMLMMMFCMGVIVRKQWVHSESLPFPLAQFTLELCREAPKGKVFNDLFRSPLTWVGAFIPIILFTMWGLKQYYPTFPAAELRWNLKPLFLEFPWDKASEHMKSGTLYLSMVAIAMLLPTDVAFSLWFFFLAWVGVDVLNAWMGRMPLSDVRGAQSFGGFVFLVATMMWIARTYLKQVARAVPKVVLRQPVDEDFRGPAKAVIGFAVSGTFAWIWLSYYFAHDAMGVFWAFSLLVMWVVMNLVMARAVIEAGLYHVELPWWPIHVAIYIFGVRIVGVDASIMFVLFSAVLINDLREGLLPYFLNSLRMTEASERIKKGHFFAAGVAAVLVAMAVGTFAHLMLHYKLGYHRFDGWGTYGAFRDTFGELNGAIQRTQKTTRYLIHFCIGGGTTAFLSWMRLKYAWWPFHPLGFVLARSYPVEVFWMPIAFGWMGKVMILRYGGAKVYYRIRPLIYGIILGECIMAGVWMVVGIFVYLSGAEPVPVRLLPG
ncbi:MAG TPA: hypothetical protein PL033_08695 [Candidatus Brocadiia bacterium]|nr:hypothetical protein [Candidatus Brocadiia bacterium]